MSPQRDIVAQLDCSRECAKKMPWAFNISLLTPCVCVCQSGNKGRIGARLNRRAVTRAKRSTHCDQFLIALERERNVHAAPVLLCSFIIQRERAERARERERERERETRPDQTTARAPDALKRSMSKLLQHSICERCSDAFTSH